MNLRLRVALACLALFLLASAAPLQAEDRIVAVGDVHGDYDGLVRILRAAGVLDAKLRWIGGRTTLVVAGDFVDRGPDVRRVMDLLMNLERAAPRRRGKVVVLLGNHEAMNMTSNFPYVSSETYASFADRKSQKRREDAYQKYAAAHEKHAERYGAGALKTLDEYAWMTKHPPGYLEFQQALTRNGKYGKWLRSKPSIAKIGDTVFVHGGISPEVADEGIEKLNSRIRIELEGIDRIRDYLAAQKLILPFYDFDEIRDVVEQEAGRLDDASADLRRVVASYRVIYQWTLYSSFGPLWFRGYAEWSDEEGEREIGVVLEKLGAKRIVVGHTMPAGTKDIVARFGQRVFLIDTGMLETMAPGGRPSALEITGRSVVAIYESGRVEFPPQPSAAARMHDPLRVASAEVRPMRRSAIVLFADSDPLERQVIVWRGPKETRLPFASATEVADFLRGSKLVKVDRKVLPGSSQPRRLLVENGGVRARAVFRTHHREEENGHWETGEFVPFLRDTWKNEVAAFELSGLLGVPRVPPTALWRMKKKEGSLQLWIEKARPGWHFAETEQPSDPELWKKHLDSVRVFDALIHNVDRHELNMLIDASGRVWWIDHTRSFGRERELKKPEQIERCERRLWEGLRTVSAEELVRTLRPHMSQHEIDALLERHVKLVALLQQRIDEKGEAAVLFDIDENAPLFSVKPVR